MRTLGELCDVFDGPHATPRTTESGPIFLGISSLQSGRLDLTAKRHLSEDDFVRWTRRVTPQAGDLVFSYETRIGEAASIPEGLRCCLGRRMGLLRPNAEVDRRFLLYAYLGPQFQAAIRERTVHGSTVERILLTELPSFPICVPRLDEQRRVARVLGALDDKIESNRRIAATLEEIAASLFKARFVDFVDHDDLVPSEIGPIPRGWEVGSLGEIGSAHREMTDGTSGLPYIGLDAMPKGSTVLSQWQTDNAPAGQSARFVEGDILFGKLRPYFRKVGVAPIDGRCSTEILVLRPHNSAHYGLLLGHVSSQRFIDHCVSVSRGTRMPRSEWKDAGSFEVAVPPSAEAAELDRVVRSIYGVVRARTHSSRTLAALRDTLLPKLISGQIRVLADAFEDAAAVR